jgi:hypothetical protein
MVVLNALAMKVPAAEVAEKEKEHMPQKNAGVLDNFC